MMTSNAGASSPPTRTNRLALEKSPYLLQHAQNPVNWFAWRDEALEKARRENRPIFLSIGYSTCHWCHVMERESFEDAAVADFLNEHFVSIKVDREERPDVDRIYMMFVQATTGQGGWPLNVFLTPELKPFYGGTYFPPGDMHGRLGFLKCLQRIHELWISRREALTDSAADLQKQLAQMSALPPADAGERLDTGVLRQAASLLKQNYDPRHGGFGGAPKFPQPSQPQFLLRYGRRFGDDEAVEMVLRTCDHMAAGGIHDQLGGGFARYSVDAEWRVPHFEKMLYDNAQLATLYLDAFLASRGLSERQTNGVAPQTYAEVARDILDYVLRDMTHPEGGFYSAEDADSEGHEGKYYCWTRAELEASLTPAEFAVTARRFGITEKGNFIDHSHPSPLPNQNVLSLVDPTLSEKDKPVLASALSKMREARGRRVRPHLDDKVLVSWNGLMLGAFARAGIVLGNGKYRAAAEKNLAFLQAKLWQPADPKAAKDATHQVGGTNAGSLFHRWRDGQRDEVELLEGYAFLLAGVLDLYEATLEPKHLEFAVALAESLVAKFYDRENGGFWQTVTGVPHLILRVKEHYDGAEPSGNSVAIMGLLRLAAITGRQDFDAVAGKSMDLFAGRLRDVPQAMSCLLQALDFRLGEIRRVVIAGPPGSDEMTALLGAAHSVYQPGKVVLGNLGAVDDFTRGLPATDGAAAYVCTGTACQAPTKDPAELRELLS